MADQQHAKDLRVAWTLGQLSWKLDPNQLAIYEAFHASPERRFVLNCSRRLGKSYELCLLALEKAIQQPGAQIRYAAPTAKMVRTIVMPLMRQILEDCPEDLRPNFNSQDGVYRFQRGRGTAVSEIHLVGCDNGGHERLRGASCDLWIIDEAGLIDELIYVVEDILMPQTLTTDGRGIMASTPPKTPAHPFKHYCDQAMRLGSYCHRTIYDNPRLSKAVVERQKRDCGGETSTTWRREFLAEFVVDTSTAVVPEFEDATKDPDTGDLRPSRHVQAWPAPPYRDCYVSMDVGFLDLTVALFGYWDFAAGKLVVEDEVSLRRMTTQELADRLHDKERELWGDRQPYLRVSDIDYIVIADLTKLHGLRFVPTAKDDKEAAVNALRIAFLEDRVVIAPRCEVLRFHLSTAVWNESQTRYARIDPTDPSYGHFDGVDALVYMWRNINRNRNPYPRLAPGVGHPQYWVPPELRDATQAQDRAVASALAGPLRRSRRR